MLALLVLHHPALLVEPGLRDRPDHVAHAVGLQPEQVVQRVFRRVLEIVGAVLAGGAVHVGGADLLGGLEKVVVEVLAAVEHQVLEQMGEPGLARFLVLRADVIPDVHGHDGRLVIFVDKQRQSVIKDEAGVWNIDGCVGLYRRGADGQNGQKRKYECCSVLHNSLLALC